VHIVFCLGNLKTQFCFGPRRIREYNIKVYFRKTEIKCISWIILAKDRKEWTAFVNMVMNYRSP